MLDESRQALRRLLHRLKVTVSSAERILPDFVIVGAQKAGTTSLHHYLQQHPRILPPSSKEVHFFDTNYAMGLDWYRGFFARASTKQALAARLGAPVLTFEASPYYMYHPLAIERMAADLPGVKAIAMLRNPIERTWSHYWHEHRKGQDELSLEEAIGREPERLAGEAARIRAEPDYFSYAHSHFSYLDRSRYAPQVARLFQALGRENVCLVKAEAFFADPETETGRVFDFLGLPPVGGIDYAPQNVGGHGDRISPETVARLRTIFDEDYDRLRELAGPTFDWFESA